MAFLPAPGGLSRARYIKSLQDGIPSSLQPQLGHAMALSTRRLKVSAPEKTETAELLVCFAKALVASHGS